MKRLLWLFAGLPLGIVLVTLALANRHPVRLVLDPFQPAEPVLSLELPFFVYLLGVLILGVLIGGAAVWSSQRRWRRAARLKSLDAVRWRAEADRLQRERDQAGRKQLAAAER